MIIGINGKIGAGKDTLGLILQYVAHTGGKYEPEHFEKFISTPGLQRSIWSNWETKKCAGKLKQIASILTGIPAEKFEDQDFKKTHLGREWDTLEIKNRPVRRQDGWNAPAGQDIVTNRMTVRDFLQKLGTDAIRNGLHDNAWINALYADYQPSWNTEPEEHIPNGKAEPKYPNWIVTDIRFPNEAQAIKDRGGIVVRIERPNNPFPVSDHISETALNSWDFDVMVTNAGAVKELIEPAKKILVLAKEGQFV